MSNSTTENNVPQTQEERKQVQVIKNVSDQVLGKINSFIEHGDINLPANYSAGNALKSAWLIIQEVKDRNGQPALSVCTQTSIANALLKMAIQGLSVVKKQGSFIVYGNQLNFQIEYSGNVALAKRYAGVKEIKGNAIFEGDKFEFEVDSATGRRKLIKHEQTLESYGSSKIIGAYAIITHSDDRTDLEIMNFAQIEKAWLQNPSGKLTKAHINFPDQQAIKTVINRACKSLIRTSDDSAIIEEEGEETTKTSSATEEFQDAVYVEEIVEIKDPESAISAPKQESKEPENKTNQEEPESAKTSKTDLFSESTSDSKSEEQSKDGAPF